MRESEQNEQRSLLAEDVLAQTRVRVPPDIDIESAQADEDENKDPTKTKADGKQKSSWIVRHSLLLLHIATILNWITVLTLSVTHHKDIPDEDTRKTVQQVLSFVLTFLTGFSMTMHYGFFARKNATESRYKGFNDKLQIYKNRYKEISSTIKKFEKIGVSKEITNNWRKRFKQIVKPKTLNSDHQAQRLQTRITSRSQEVFVFAITIPFFTLLQMVFQGVDLSEKHDLHNDVGISATNAVIAITAIAYYWLLYKRYTFDKADEVIKIIDDMQGKLNEISHSIHTETSTLLGVNQKELQALRQDMKSNRQELFNAKSALTNRERELQVVQKNLWAKEAAIKVIEALPETAQQIQFISNQFDENYVVLQKMRKSLLEHRQQIVRINPIYEKKKDEQVQKFQSIKTSLQSMEKWLRKKCDSIDEIIQKLNKIYEPLQVVTQQLPNTGQLFTHIERVLSTICQKLVAMNKRLTAIKIDEISPKREGNPLVAERTQTTKKGDERVLRIELLQQELGTYAEMVVQFNQIMIESISSVTKQFKEVTEKLYNWQSITIMPKEETEVVQRSVHKR